MSSPNMAEPETTLDFRVAWHRGTRPVPWEEGFSLEIKYVKSCGTIMAGIIQLAQGEVHLHTPPVCSVLIHTHITCTQTLTHLYSCALRLTYTALIQTGIYYCLCAHGFT